MVISLIIIGILDMGDASIDTERLDFINLTEDRWGSFVRPERLDSFLDTDIGKAQLSLIEDQVKDQMGDDYDLSIEKARRILFTEQSLQDYGKSATLSNKDLLESHGATWLDRLSQSWNEAVNGADSYIDQKVDEIGPRSKDPRDEGTPTGVGGRWAADRIDSQINSAMSSPSSGM